MMDVTDMTDRTGTAGRARTAGTVRTAASLGARIKGQRKRCGMSQEKVAELVGVSRQAVTKWETGQSAPSTENLFRLAEIFGTTVDLLLPIDEGRTEEADEGRDEKGSGKIRPDLRSRTSGPDRSASDRSMSRKNLQAAVLVVACYLAVYFLGRLTGPGLGESSVMGWLFGADTNQFSYLYGWLLQTRLFWIAMAVSAVSSLFGKYRFSLATTVAFALGQALGELLGENPAGAAYGHGQYGWAIWGGAFLFSMVMGVLAERFTKRAGTGSARRLKVWWAVYFVGILGIALLVHFTMPQTFGS